MVNRYSHNDPVSVFKIISYYFSLLSLLKAQVQIMDSRFSHGLNIKFHFTFVIQYLNLRYLKITVSFISAIILA